MSTPLEERVIKTLFSLVGNPPVFHASWNFWTKSVQTCVSCAPLFVIEFPASVSYKGHCVEVNSQCPTNSVSSCPVGHCVKVNSQCPAGHWDTLNSQGTMNLPPSSVLQDMGHCELAGHCKFTSAWCPVTQTELRNINTEANLKHTEFSLELNGTIGRSL